MFGGLMVCGIRLVQKLHWYGVHTALAADMFIITMDILMDAAAIPLGEDFWVWDGKGINFNINQHTFMRVIWVAFSG